jgi:hypothetical protein
VKEPEKDRYEIRAFNHTRYQRLYQIGATTIGGDGYNDRCCGTADVPTLTEVSLEGAARALYWAEEVLGAGTAGENYNARAELRAALKEMTL